MSKPRAVSYHDYLRLDDVLGAQRPPDVASSDPGATRDLIHHDELLFIVMHQTMEIWFKMVVADLGAARDLLARPHTDDREVPEADIPRACTHLGRSALTLEHLTRQFGIIETMAPLHFLTFRDALIPASGFQSWQFRELEILAGLPESERISYEGQPYYAVMSDERRRTLEARSSEVSLRSALLHWLARTPVEEAFPGFHDVFLDAYDTYIDEQRERQSLNPNLAPAQAAAIAKRFEDAKREARRFFDDPDEVVRRAHLAYVFIATYRSEPLLRWPYALLERVLEFEEHFRLFRFRHARMVERMIGLRVGSGGSTGVEYLDRTASTYRIFGRLLQATSYLIDRARLPDVIHPEILGFRFDEEN